MIGITGGTGFVGRILVERHLAKGDIVKVLSRQPADAANLPKNIELIRADLTYPSKEINEFADSLDILYHCAGETMEPSRMYALNVLGTDHLIAAAKGKVRHWVQLSTVSVYGPNSSGIVNEQSMLNPTSRRRDLHVYAQTKMASDNRVIAAARDCGFTYSILRPSKILGPGMNDRSLDQLITLINRGLFFFIGQPGASANYVHVDNVVDALMLCGQLFRAREEIYNLSDYTTLEHVVEVICHELGIKTPKLRLPEFLVRSVAKPLQRIQNFPLTEFRIAGMTHRPVYSDEKIRNQLGFVHKVSIDEGLRQLVKIWKQS